MIHCMRLYYGFDEGFSSQLNFTCDQIWFSIWFYYMEPSIEFFECSQTKVWLFSTHIRLDLFNFDLMCFINNKKKWTDMGWAKIFF